MISWKLSSDFRNLALASTQAFLSLFKYMLPMLIQQVCMPPGLLQSVYVCELAHCSPRTTSKNYDILNLQNFLLQTSLLPQTCGTYDASMSTCNEPFTKNRSSICSKDILHIRDPFSLIYTSLSSFLYEVIS
jgi:hypothetical protein